MRLVILYLHEGEEIIVDRNFRVSFRDGDSGKAEKPEEIEANHFAAELLMPLHFLVEDLQDTRY
jgi:Zn-dependent peptidase ImmA (M78 family)